MPRLNDARHERFAQCIAFGLTIQRAYVEAGFKGESQSYATILRSQQDIAARIDELQAQFWAKSLSNRERILEELENIGYSNIEDFLYWNHQSVVLKDSRDLPRHIVAAVQEVSQTKDGVKLKLYDKRATLVDIGKELGMFKNQVEHSGNLTLDAAVDSAFNRMKTIEAKANGGVDDDSSSLAPPPPLVFQVG